MILGLHHVTATVADAQEDLDFCLAALGMRLVKKTVNFDNHDVYHFYYGDERGSPGTIWTTFPYAGMGVPTGMKARDRSPRPRSRYPPARSATGRPGWRSTAYPPSPCRPGSARRRSR
jgi:catechol 2,3-dioxygenase-like lactoylglutathione lyase family enzyme